MGCSCGTSAADVANTLLAKVRRISSSRNLQAIGQAGSGFANICSSEPKASDSDFPLSTDPIFEDSSMIGSDLGDAMGELNPFVFETLDFDVLLSL